MAKHALTGELECNPGSDERELAAASRLAADAHRESRNALVKAGNAYQKPANSAFAIVHEYDRAVTGAKLFSALPWPSREFREAAQKAYRIGSDAQVKADKYYGKSDGHTRLARKFERAAKWYSFIGAVKTVAAKIGLIHRS